MNSISNLVRNLYAAKSKEDEAKAARIAIEEELASAIGVSEQWEGSKTDIVDEFKVKVSRKMNVKIDGARLTELSHTHGLDSMLGIIFKWKPEIDKKSWDSADKAITDIFNGAITRTPGKISFTVEKKEAA